jgi:ribonuclease P protein component
MNKRFRLRKPPEFRRVCKEGKRFFSPHFVLYACANGLTVSRIGVSISKSHLKLATGRNRIRRIIRELMRREVMPVSTGRDYVVTSRPGLGKAPVREIRKETHTLVSKLVEKR